MEFLPHAGSASAYPVTFQQQVIHRLLKYAQIGLILNNFAYVSPVQIAVTLRTRGPNRRSLTRVQGTKLDSRSIGRACHHATERINFFDQVTFAYPADGRVATHLSDGFNAVRQ
jgi:hypothetical protein